MYDWAELKNVYGEAPPSFEARIRMTLDNTVTSYVSRRYVKKIKEVLSLKRRENK